MDHLHQTPVKRHGPPPGLKRQHSRLEWKTAKCTRQRIAVQSALLPCSVAVQSALEQWASACEAVIAALGSVRKSKSLPRQPAASAGATDGADHTGYLLYAHDVKQMETVFDAIVVMVPTSLAAPLQTLMRRCGLPWQRRHGRDPGAWMHRACDQPQKRGRAKEAQPCEKARRWLVEACHGWFNRFRKLLLHFEKLQHTCLDLNHLAAAIVALHKIDLPINIIDGQILRSFPSRRCRSWSRALRWVWTP